MQRLEEILALPSEAARVADVQPVSHISGRIEFERVSFAYQARRPVLYDISLTIYPGETVAMWRNPVIVFEPHRVAHRSKVSGASPFYRSLRDAPPHVLILHG